MNKFLRLIIGIILLSFFSSCNTQIRKEKQNFNKLVGKTYVGVDTVNSIPIIDDRCRVGPPSLKIINDSTIYDYYPIEGNYYKIKKIHKINNGYELNVDFDFDSKNIKLVYSKDSLLTFFYEGSYMGTYIDSTLVGIKINYIKKPCIECFSKEECDEWAREAKEKEAEVRYDQLRDSLQRLNTQIPEKWHGKYIYLDSDEGLTAGGSSTAVWATLTVTQDSIICEQQGYMTYSIDSYLPAIKYPDTLYMYLDRWLNIEGKPRRISSSSKPDVLYKKGNTFYLNDRKLDYRPLNE